MTCSFNILNIELLYQGFNPRDEIVRYVRLFLIILYKSRSKVTDIDIYTLFLFSIMANF